MDISDAELIENVISEFEFYDDCGRASMKHLDFISDRVWAWNDSIDKDNIKRVLENYISIQSVIND